MALDDVLANYLCEMLSAFTLGAPKNFFRVFDTHSLRSARG